MKRISEVPWWQISNIVPLVSLVIIGGGIVAQHQIIMSETANIKEMLRDNSQKLDEIIKLTALNKENIDIIEANQVQAFLKLNMAPPNYVK